MRCLQRNKSKFYYYLYKSRVPLKDYEGNETGEFLREYNCPVECFGNISAGNGTAQTELFGTNVTYNRVIVMDDPNCPIDTNSLLCVDIKPKKYASDQTPAYDYIVKAVAKSLNSVSIAISKVNADESIS